MALNDLTPKLRTRLGRVERLVGVFIIIATLLLVGGFVYYVWHTAKNKGWLLTKQPYFTFVESAAGLAPGQPVRMMGKDVGKVIKIETEPPEGYFNIYVEFVVNEPYYDYIWNDSRVKVASDLFGGRALEISKGGRSGITNQLTPTYRSETVGTKKKITGMWEQKRDNSGMPIFTNAGAYVEWKSGAKGFWLPMEEAPPLGDRLERVAKQAEEALPNILNLTNRLQTVLDNAALLTSNLNQSVDKLQPTLESVALITGNLRDPKGSLGEWIFPTNINTKLESTLGQLDQTLGSADAVLEVTETNLATVLSNFNLSLINLADITSNLNSQIGQNSNLVMNIDTAIRNADVLMQGLKKHWFLRSAFKEKKPDEKKTDAKSK